MTLYRQLQAYVRGELANSYGPHRMPRTGHIPAHLVDGSSGVSWYPLYHTVLPYKFAQRNFLSSKVGTVNNMLQVVDQFYQSMGYDPLQDSFRASSQLTASTDPTTVQVCRPPRVWNFLDHQDYRVTSCLDVSHRSMRSAVELAGSVLTLRGQSSQPFVLQENFDDDYVTAAVSGALSLAFLTPQHLRQIGLLQPHTSNPQGNNRSFSEDEINFLMAMALDRLPPLAWYHVVSQWQTTTVRETSSGNWNSEWWKLRCSMEGVSPPDFRDEMDFDAGASPNVLLNVSGKSMVQSGLLQFQILKSLCHAARHTGPLTSCNLRGSTAVGQKIRDVLNQGKQLTPAEKLQRLTGSWTVKASAMSEYFQPLATWLSQRPSLPGTRWAAACPDPDTGKE
ncbi:hypothetical protein ACOMHN_046694 [Nucella lapillus]